MKLDDNGTHMRVTIRLCKECKNHIDVSESFIRSNHEINSIECDICGWLASRLYHNDIPKDILSIHRIKKFVKKVINNLKVFGIPIRKRIIPGWNPNYTMPIENLRTERIAHFQNISKLLDKVKLYDPIRDEGDIISRLGVDI